MPIHSDELKKQLLHYFIQQTLADTNARKLDTKRADEIKTAWLCSVTPTHEPTDLSHFVLAPRVANVNNKFFTPSKDPEEAAREYKQFSDAAFDVLANTKLSKLTEVLAAIRRPQDIAVFDAIPDDKYAVYSVQVNGVLTLRLDNRGNIAKYNGKCPHTRNLISGSIHLTKEDVLALPGVFQDINGHIYSSHSVFTKADFSNESAWETLKKRIDLSSANLASRAQDRYQTRNHFSASVRQQLISSIPSIATNQSFLMIFAFAVALQMGLSESSEVPYGHSSNLFSVTGMSHDHDNHVHGYDDSPFPRPSS